MADNLLSIRDLSVSFRTQQGDIDAVRKASFDIPHGRTMALVGESGSGKSVTALAIMRLHDEKVVKYTSGSVRYGDTDLMALNEEQVRAYRGRKIAMIFQEPMSSLNPVHTIGAQLRESLGVYRTLDNTAATRESISLLERVGIRDPERRLKDYPHMLSGGQRQRVMIAMALACEPELLIADEPTTALDVTIQRQILELLRDIQAERKLSILLITHDLNLVRHYADTVCVMQDGVLVEQGDTEPLFASPQHEYTRYLIDSEPDERIARMTVGEEAVIDASTIKCHFPVTAGFFKRQVDVIKAVDEVDIHINRGETLGIVGESGSGKTTLGMALLRLVDASGDIRFRGHTISEYSEHQMRPLRRYFQVVFQDPFSSLSPRMTVGQIISEGLELHFPAMTREQRQHKILSTLAEVGMEPDILWRYPHEFSGGQRQRIAIARVMVLEPELVLLDEPTSALDVSVQKQVLTLLADLQQKHALSYLFISHDLRVVNAMSHRVIVLQQGRVVEAGPVEQVLQNPTTDYARSLAAAALYQ